MGNRSSFGDVRYDNVQKYQDNTQRIGILFWAALARDGLKTQGVLLVSAQARIRLRGIHLTRPLRSAGGCLDPERVIWNHGFGTNLGVLLTKGLKPGRSIIAP